MREWFRMGPGQDLSISGNRYHLLSGSGIFHAMGHIFYMKSYFVRLLIVIEPEK